MSDPQGVAHTIRRVRTMRRISSYGSKLHPHHYWIIERMYNMLERNGCLDYEDPEIIEDIKWTLITCNPKNRT
jgi:hypothetical protein